MRDANWFAALTSSSGGPSSSSGNNCGRPAVWDSRCATVILSQPSGRPSTYLRTLAFRSILPSSASIMTAVAVKGFVSDAKSKTLSRVTSEPVSRFATP